MYCNTSGFQSLSCGDEETKGRKVYMSLTYDLSVRLAISLLYDFNIVERFILVKIITLPLHDDTVSCLYLQCKNRFQRYLTRCDL